MVQAKVLYGLANMQTTHLIKFFEDAQSLALLSKFLRRPLWKWQHWLEGNFYYGKIN